MKVFPRSSIFLLKPLISPRLRCLGRFEAYKLTPEQHLEISRKGWCKDGDGYLLLEKAIPKSKRKDVWNDKCNILDIIDWIGKSIGTYGK